MYVYVNTHIHTYIHTYHMGQSAPSVLNQRVT